MYLVQKKYFVDSKWTDFIAVIVRKPFNRNKLVVTMLEAVYTQLSADTQVQESESVSGRNKRYRNVC